MKGKVFFTCVLALLLALFLMAPTNIEAKYKWRKLKITEVFVSCDTDDKFVEIIGEDLDFGRGPLIVVLGEYGELEIIEATEDSILAKAPPGMCKTPGDFVLTITNGRGFRVRDKWNLTIGAVATGAFGQAKLDAIINILCNDGNDCSTDSIDWEAAQCTHTWPDCGIEDGCCGPDCTPETDVDCVRANNIVFVTSQMYTGNVGGVSGADAKCQSAAVSAGLPGTFSAWIADSTQGSAPNSRFNQYNTPYVLVDGTVVAESWDELTDGDDLSAAIAMDENGVAATNYVKVWTNVQPDGSAFQTLSHLTCSDWTSELEHDPDDINTKYSGQFGWVPYYSPPGWTMVENTSNPYNDYSSCTNEGALYCFQQ